MTYSTSHGLIGYRAGYRLVIFSASHKMVPLHSLERASVNRDPLVDAAPVKCPAEEPCLYRPQYKHIALIPHRKTGNAHVL